MEYHEAGDLHGTPVLLLQGTLQTGRTLCRLANASFAAHGLRAVCPTLPGYGYSTWTDLPLTEYWRDIEQLADHLGIAKFAGLGGWSGGGLVATAVASGMPVARLGDTLLLVVAAPPSIWWYNYSTLGRAYLWVAGHTRLNELLTHYAVLPMLRRNCTAFFTLSTPADELEQLQHSPSSPYSMDAICADMVQSVSDYCERGYTSLATKWMVETPIDWAQVSLGGMRKTTIVYAERDTLITPLAALRYHEHIPGSTLYCAPGQGHGTVGIDVLPYIGVFWGE
jgi:pimeloyl-ACP methyl ester carboxylesterase